MLGLFWEFRDVVYIMLILVLVYLLTRPHPCPQSATIVRDTVVVHDTVYMGSAFSLSAARCESLRVKANTKVQSSFWVQAPTGHATPRPSYPPFAPPRWSVGVGTLYPLKPYGVVEYYPRPYLGLGIYVEPTTPRRIGTHVKVRF